MKSPKSRTVIYTNLAVVEYYDENEVVIPPSIGVITEVRDGKVVVESRSPRISGVVVGEVVDIERVNKLTIRDTKRVANSCLKASKELLKHYHRLKDIIEESEQLVSASVVKELVKKSAKDAKTMPTVPTVPTPVTDKPRTIQQESRTKKESKKGGIDSSYLGSLLKGKT